MLIRTQKDLAPVIREYERKHAGGQVQCAFCNQSISAPPIFKIEVPFKAEEHFYYHMKCGMQIVYSIQEGLSGYGAEIVEPMQPTAMEGAFRAAAHRQSPPQ